MSATAWRKASKPFQLTVAAALGIVGAAYRRPPQGSYSAPAVTGGTPPYLGASPSGTAGLSLTPRPPLSPAYPRRKLTFTVQVTDNNSVTASKQFTLAVSSNLAITTASPLPEATTGAAYSRTLVASGGVPPYVWTVTAGGLPTGLAIDPASNSIAGTPTASGAYAFTLQVADASGASTTRDFTLAVNLPPLPSVSMDGLQDPANAADQPSFSVSLATPYPPQLTGQIGRPSRPMRRYRRMMHPSNSRPVDEP